MAQDVFVSHASEDHVVAMQVCELLEQRGVRCWIAPRNVSAGAVWDEAILDAIEGAGVFLLILSARANESSFVKNEVNRAFAEGKPIITFRVEDVMPGRSLQLYLARHHWTDAFPPPIEPRVDELAASITRLLDAAGEIPPTAVALAPGESTVTRREPLRVPPVPRRAASRIGFRRWGVLGGVAVGVLIGGAVMWRLRPAPPPPPVTRSTFTLAEGQFLPTSASRYLAISPDGTRMAYIAEDRLYVRLMSEFEARPITESDLRPSVPVFSPDGRSIAFAARTDRTIKRIGVTGGATVTLCQAENSFALNWGSDGILFGTGVQGIQRVSEHGGTPETLVTFKAAEQANAPQMLPDGQTLLFTQTTGTGPDRWNNAKIVAQNVKSGARRIVIERGTDGQYLPSGHLLFVREGVVHAVAFDVNRLETAGSPVPVVEGVKRGGIGSSVASTAQFRVSATGTAIYVSGPVATATDTRSLGFFDRKGASEMFKVPPGPYEHPRLSPDGRQIAFSSEKGAIWIYDLSGASAVRRLSLDGQGSNHYPIWSADSQRVTFQSDREKDLGLFWQRADGSGAAERLVTADEGTELIPEAWSPDGRRLLYCARARDGKSVLWMWSTEEKKAEPFAAVVSSGRGLSGAVFSPDGKWVAYASKEGGRSSSAVYLQPFPPTGGKYQISKDEDDGHHPRWSPDGGELFFVPGPNRLEVVKISTQPTFALGEPVRLDGKFSSTGPSYPRPWDISSDGQHFLGLSNARIESSATRDREIRVVVNWLEELKRKVPVK